MIESIGTCPKCGKRINIEYTFNEHSELEYIIDCPFCGFYKHFAYGALFDRNGIVTEILEG